MSNNYDDSKDICQNPEKQELICHKYEDAKALDYMNAIEERNQVVVLWKAVVNNQVKLGQL